MFLKHYQLHEQPFGVTPDPRYTYFTSTHREALASLAYAVEVGSGFTVMVARPGMGKTTLLFRLLDYLQDKARTVFVFHTQCNSVDLMRYILADMKIKYSGKDLVDMHALLNQALLSEARLGRTVVVAIDESQNLGHEVLETIRLLSDFETPRRKLLQIILCGQPELGRKLAHPDLVQLRQRITVLCRLAPLSVQEVAGYVDHRLKVAGYPGTNLFSPEAIQLIHRESRGIPRVINTLCSGALTIGCALGRIRVDTEVVREVMADLSVDFLLEELNTSEQAPPPLPEDEILPQAPSVPPYMHDAPLTQALAAALARPPARSPKSEYEEMASLQATETATFEPSAQLPEPTTRTAIEPLPAPEAPSAASSQVEGEVAIAFEEPKSNGQWVPEKTEQASPIRALPKSMAMSGSRKIEGGLIVGAIFLATGLLGLSLRFGAPGTKAGSRPFIIPDSTNANPSSEAATRNQDSLTNQNVVRERASGAQPVVHVVQSNETLSGISIEYLGHYDDKVLEEVQKDNAGLTDPDLIHVGQRVLLPSDSAAKDSPMDKASNPTQGKP